MAGCEAQMARLRGPPWALQPFLPALSCCPQLAGPQAPAAPRVGFQGPVSRSPLCFPFFFKAPAFQFPVTLPRVEMGCVTLVREPTDSKTQGDGCKKGPPVSLMATWNSLLSLPLPTPTHDEPRCPHPQQGRSAQGR